MQNKKKATVLDSSKKMSSDKTFFVPSLHKQIKKNNNNDNKQTKKTKHTNKQQKVTQKV